MNKSNCNNNVEINNNDMSQLRANFKNVNYLNVEDDSEPILNYYRVSSQLLPNNWIVKDKTDDEEGDNLIILPEDAREDIELVVDVYLWFERIRPFLPGFLSS